jgi:hypothetical protein
LKKSENLKFYEYRKFIFWNLAFQPLDIHVAISRSSTKIHENLNLQPVLNNESFQIDMELELGVLGIDGKLAKAIEVEF